MVIANTGDDFEHLGLSISPDIDTVMYTLSGLANPEFGWGRHDETWSFMETLASVGGEDWFRLGDRDLAVHVERTRRLRAGETLTAITADFASVSASDRRVLPMSDDPVRTRCPHRRRLDRVPGLLRALASAPQSCANWRSTARRRRGPAFLAALADPRPLRRW